MKHFFNRAIFLSYLIVCSQTAYAQWTHFGLKGKSVTDMAANQVDGSVLAIADEKLYVTSNNGVDWSLLENGVEGLQVLSLAVDIDDVIYIGTSNGLFASTDKGTTFQPLNDQLPNDFGLYPAVGAVCALNDHLFIGTSAGVYKAEKSSLRWQLFNNGLPLVEDVNAILVFLNDQIFLGMNTGMYRTSVREANWQKVYDNVINDIIVVGPDLYAAGASEECRPAIRSSDFGDTWEALGPGSGACVGLTILGQGNSLWVGTSAWGAMNFSFDKGVTWDDIQIPKTNKVQVFVRRGSSLLAATDYFTTTSNLYEGGVFIRSNIFENIRETLQYPEFDVPPGEYSEPFQIQLNPRQTSAQVYYTTDGTVPDVNSTRYEAPIMADESTLISAVSIDETGARSRVNVGYFKISAPLAVEDEKDALTQLFPNPCTDQIKLSLREATKTNIQVFDGLGRVVYESVVTSNEETIATRAFMPGVYYVVARSSKKSSCRRFLKL